MGRQRFTPEQIVAKLREVDVIDSAKRCSETAYSGTNLLLKFLFPV